MTDAPLSPLAKRLINDGLAPRTVAVPRQEPIIAALYEASWIILELEQANRTRDPLDRSARIQDAIGRSHTMLTALRDAAQELAA